MGNLVPVALAGLHVLVLLPAGHRMSPTACRVQIAVLLGMVTLAVKIKSCSF